MQVSNKFYMEKQMPDQLGILNLLPLSKPGDLSKTENYRGITLTSLIMKTIHRMMLNRLETCHDPFLRSNQSGFRHGRIIVAQDFALRWISEEVPKNKLPAVLVFIDFKKAFDSINHQTMFNNLKAYGVTPRMLAAIKLCYQNLKAKVISPDSHSDIFKIYARVIQDDALAPFLFVTVLDYALRNASVDIIRIWLKFSKSDWISDPILSKIRPKSDKDVFVYAISSMFSFSRWIFSTFFKTF